MRTGDNIRLIFTFMVICEYRCLNIRLTFTSFCDSECLNIRLIFTFNLVIANIYLCIRLTFTIISVIANIEITMAGNVL